MLLEVTALTKLFDHKLLFKFGFKANKEISVCVVSSPQTHWPKMQICSISFIPSLDKAAEIYIDMGC